MTSHVRRRSRAKSKRIEAAWLALDQHTDEKTLDRMLAAARAGRRVSAQRQREQHPPKPKP